MHTPDTTLLPESITQEEVLAVLSKTTWLTHTQVLQAISDKRTEQGESPIPAVWKYKKRIKDLLGTLSLRGTVSTVNITQLGVSKNYDKSAVDAERERLRRLIDQAEDSMREIDFTANSIDLYRLRS